jgi:uncharacterized protein (TIGR03382 family)
MTMCGSTCTNGLLAPNACDGNGACVAGASAPCPSNYACADGASCKTSCASDKDCTSGYCNNGACAQKQVNNQATQNNSGCGAAPFAPDPEIAVPVALLAFAGGAVARRRRPRR